MSDGKAYTMEALLEKADCPAVKFKEDPYIKGLEHDYMTLLSVETVEIKNGNVMIPAFPWSRPYELYGLKSINQNVLNVLHEKASSPHPDAVTRILGVFPTIAFPVLKSAPVIVETPWFVARVKFKGAGTVTSLESKIQRLKVNPIKQNLEVESDEIKGHINSSFEIDTKELSAPVPKFTVKNTFMGMEVSAEIKVDVPTPFGWKITFESKVSAPVIKKYKDFQVTLAFGFEAEVFIRKSERNGRSNPFEGIEMPAAIPLGEPFFYDNVSSQISQQWKDLVSFPDFSAKQNNGLLDIPDQQLKGFSNAFTVNAPSQQLRGFGNNSQQSNITWHQEPNASSQNTNQRYLRTMTLSKHTTPTPNPTVVRNVGTFTKVLPFLLDAAEGLGVAIMDNPELLVLLF